MRERKILSRRWNRRVELNKGTNREEPGRERDASYLYKPGFDDHTDISRTFIIKKERERELVPTQCSPTDHLVEERQSLFQLQTGVSAGGHIGTHCYMEHLYT